MKLIDLTRLAAVGANAVLELLWPVKVPPTSPSATGSRGDAPSRMGGVRTESDIHPSAGARPSGVSVPHAPPDGPPTIPFDVLACAVADFVADYTVETAEALRGFADYLDPQ